MTEVSVYGASAPDGTKTLYADGSPSILLAHSFYTYGATLDAYKIAGGRVWVPSGGATPAAVIIKLWLPPAGANNTDNITGAPTAEKQVSVAGTDMWTEAKFDTYYTPPADGLRWLIGYQFVGADNVKYCYDSGAYVTAPPFGGGLAWAEDNNGGSLNGPTVHGYFRMGAGAVGYPSSGNGYCIDCIMSDQAPGGGGDTPVGTVTDQQITKLGTAGQSTGSLRDRQVGYLKAQGRSGSIADMQVANGQRPGPIVVIP